MENIAKGEISAFDKLVLSTKTIIDKTESNVGIRKYEFQNV